MSQTFICVNCDKSFLRNPRVKNQKYCSSRKCQNARRATTNKTKYKKSKESRSKRKDRNKRWRDGYPAHTYQKQYREEHPEYVKRNRELQKDRNTKQKKDHASIIVKTYTLAPQPLRDGAYMGFEVKSGKIVKTYAFMAQMHTQHSIETFSRKNPG